MIDTGFLQKRIWRVLCGVALIGIGIFVGYLSRRSPDIIKTVCGDDSPVWCLPLRVVLYDFGLTSISYTFIVLGVAMAILYNFIAELVSSILTFAMNHISNSRRVLIDAMEKNRISREESKSIIIETTSRYMGYFDENSRGVGEFFADNVIDRCFKDGGFWRRDYHSIINVERLNDEIYGALSNRYLRWNETLTYTISNVGEGKVYRYYSASSVEIIDIGDVEKIIRNYRYDIRVSGQRIFSFEEHRNAILTHNFRENPEYKNDGLTVKVDDSDFHFSFSADVFVKGTIADIVVDEESFISIEDRIYQLTFNESTKRVTFRLNLPHDLEIYHYGITGTRFGTKRSSHVHPNQHAPNRISIDIGDWTLPGLVAILAWKEKQTPTMPIGEPDGSDNSSQG